MQEGSDMPHRTHAQRLQLACVTRSPAMEQHITFDAHASLAAQAQGAAGLGAGVGSTPRGAEAGAVMGTVVPSTVRT